MTLVVPNVGEVIVLDEFLAGTLTLKLFSNDIIPGELDTASSYDEVSGGGYSSKSINFAGWTITPGDPSTATYAAQDFSFTGVTNAPGTVYGYYLVDGSNVLRWAERFPEAVLPFTPGNGSLVRVTLLLAVS